MMKLHLLGIIALIIGLLSGCTPIQVYHQTDREYISRLGGTPESVQFYPSRPIILTNVRVDSTKGVTETGTIKATEKTNIDRRVIVESLPIACLSYRGDTLIIGINFNNRSEYLRFVRTDNSCNVNKVVASSKELSFQIRIDKMLYTKKRRQQITDELKNNPKGVYMLIVPPNGRLKYGDLVYQLDSESSCAILLYKNTFKKSTKKRSKREKGFKVKKLN